MKKIFLIISILMVIAQSVYAITYDINISGTSQVFGNIEISSIFNATTGNYVVNSWNMGGQEADNVGIHYFNHPYYEYLNSGTVLYLPNIDGYFDGLNIVDNWVTTTQKPFAVFIQDPLHSLTLDNLCDYGNGIFWSEFLCWFEPGTYLQNMYEWGSGYQVSISLHNDSVPTPEPSTVLLLGAGLSGLALWRKKKTHIHSK